GSFASCSPAQRRWTATPAPPPAADPALRDGVLRSRVAGPDYLRRILNARVYDVAVETPLEIAPRLSARIGGKLLLKREDLQPVFSFKLRGAYNKMVNLPVAAL